MGLPPGGVPIPVSGIEAGTDPKLSGAAGQLNAWIEYLLHPESNDGPRIYRYHHPVNPGETELAHRNSFQDSRPAEYQTVSVLEKYAGDTDAFFRPAQAVSGISEPIIDQTYAKLIQGFFTWTASDNPHKPQERDVLRYQELNAARSNWQQMRNGWISTEANAAHAFEEDFILFHLFTENCVYVVAEHLVRYRAIFKKASEDIAELMTKLTDQFATFDPRPHGAGVSLDFLSIVVTGLVVATTTVITGGTGATVGVVLAAATLEMLGEAVKTANSNGTETKYQLESREHLRDVAQQYLDAVNKIELDVATAVKQLYESLQMEVGRLRTERTYEAKPTTGQTATAVPRYRDYL